MGIKIGDVVKVVKGDYWTKKGEEFEVFRIETNAQCREVILFAESEEKAGVFEEQVIKIKEDKTMTKNFKEVIADIKEGEVWKSRGEWIIKTVKMAGGNLFIDTVKGEELSINRNTKFQLQRKKVSFTEAFAAYEEGKEIESCFTSRIYSLEKEEREPYSINASLINMNEIRGEWYINA